MSGHKLKIRSIPVEYEYLGWVFCKEWPCIQYITRNNKAKAWVVRLIRLDEPVLIQYFCDHSGNFAKSYKKALHFLEIALFEYRQNDKLYTREGAITYTARRTQCNQIEHRVGLTLMTVRKAKWQLSIYFGHQEPSPSKVAACRKLLKRVQRWINKEIEEKGKERVFKCKLPSWYTRGKRAIINNGRY